MKAQNDEYTLELYKSLRSEIASYMEKVPGLWLQKFVLIGGVIAFLIGKSEEMRKVNSTNRIIIAAVLSLPVLAMLIDAKMLEYGFHARVISKFIRINFPDPPALANWESSLWGDSRDKEIGDLVWFRSLTTVVVTIAPTAILTILSGIVIGEITGETTIWLSLAGIVTALYVAINYYVWRRVWSGK
jgi:hypothetical protein